MSFTEGIVDFINGGPQVAFRSITIKNAQWIKDVTKNTRIAQNLNPATAKIDSSLQKMIINPCPQCLTVTVVTVKETEYVKSIVREQPQRPVKRLDFA